MTSSKSRRECSDKSLLLARKYRSEGKVARAFAHYLVHWHLGIGNNQHSSPCSIEEISQVLRELSSTLAAQDRISDLISTYQQAIDVLPLNEDNNYQLAHLYIKQGLNCQAIKLLDTCVGLKCKNLNNTVKSNVLPRWHFAMLNDTKRNEAFDKALAQVIRPQDKVIDIGTGSGILALFAAKARPQKVLACEVSKELVEIAKSSTQNHPCIQIIHSLSTHLKNDDGPFDVLVTETFDAGLFGEHVLETLDHAWKNLLHTQSKVVPSKAKVYIALGTCPKLYQSHRLCKARIGNLTFDNRHFSSIQKENYDCHKKIKPEDILSDVNTLLEVDFQNSSAIEECLKSTLDFHHQLKVQKKGQADCIVMWFELYLTESIYIATGPQNPDSCWNPAVFVLDAALQVEANDQIQSHFQLQSSFRLVSVQHNKAARIDNPKASYHLPTSMIQKINYFENQTTDETMKNVKTILDLTDLPLQSLNWMKNDSSLELTMYLNNVLDDDDDFSTKTKLDLVTDFATQNGISLEQINGISSIQALQNDEPFDLIVFDPILPNGRLNSTQLMEISQYRRFCRRGILANPHKCTLWVALIESEELVRSHRVMSKEYESLNSFSCHHLQNLRLDEFQFKTLSQAINIHHFQFQHPDPNADHHDLPLESEWSREEFEVAIEHAGRVDAILYWFEIVKSPFNTMSSFKTYDSLMIDKAAFLLDTPIAVDPVTKNDFLTIEFAYEDFLIDLSVTE